MHEYVEQALPILKRALFDDPDENVRRSAFTCLLPLSRQDAQARALLERAAAAHPIRTTHESPEADSHHGIRGNRTRCRIRLANSAIHSTKVG